MVATALAILGPFSNTRSKAPKASSRRFGENQRPKRAKTTFGSTPTPSDGMPVFSVAEANRVAEALTDMGLDVQDVPNELLVSILNDVADRGSSYILAENK
jgi:hypothetical protein